MFDDGEALFDAVVEHGLEGVVAKRRNGIYRPGHRGWVKTKIGRTGAEIRRSSRSDARSSDDQLPVQRSPPEVTQAQGVRLSRSGRP
jgi:ATP-dependent DNA ligase